MFWPELCPACDSWSCWCDGYCSHCGRSDCDCDLDPPEFDGFDEDHDATQEYWELV